MTLHNIVAKLGGDLWAGGAQANIPAPGHSARDRSVSLRIGSDGRIIVNTFAGTDWRIVMDDLRERGLIDRSKMPVVVGGRARTSFPDPVLSVSERVHVAEQIWSAGREATSRTLSYQHVRLRRVERRFPSSNVLRHANGAPIRAFDRGCRRSNPALLVAVSDSQGGLTAVEITFLDPNARRSRRIALSRKTVGPIPAGSAVRLDPIDDEMAAGEGVFSTLSGSERFDLPAWALLSTSNMRRFSPPEGLRRLLIVADRGRDGELSANMLATQARRRGVKVWIEYPPLPAQDWSEAAGDKSAWPGVHRRVPLELSR